MAALADRDPDLSPAERTRAEALLETCGSCSNLFAELAIVSAAIPTAATPPRSRDFTLTPADAARLRPRGLRRLLAGIVSARDDITFPLAMGLTTMGIAGLLLATVPAMLPFGAAGPTSLSPVGAPAVGAGGAAPDASSAAAAASEGPVAAESSELFAASGAPPADTSGEGAFTGDDGEPTAIAQRQDGQDMLGNASVPDDRAGRSAFLILAATLLLAGLGLFVLRWSARRL